VRAVYEIVIKHLFSQSLRIRIFLGVTSEDDLSTIFLGKHVLLVEDSAIIAMGQELILRDFGFTITTVYRGRDAVEYVRNRESVDIVLMDIDLGKEMDGLEAARQILAIRELPVLFLAAQKDHRIVEQARSISPYGYVLKGSSDFVLGEAMRMAFELSHARRLLQQIKRDTNLCR